MIVKVVGVSFKNKEYAVDRQTIIKKLHGEEQIYLKREPNNRFDKNAVAVVLKRSSGDFKLGYVRSELAGLLSDFWKDYKFTARIREIFKGNEEERISWGLRIDIRKINRNKLKTKKKKSNYNYRNHDRGK